MELNIEVRSLDAASKLIVIGSLACCHFTRIIVNPIVHEGRIPAGRFLAGRPVPVVVETGATGFFA